VSYVLPGAVSTYQRQGRPETFQRVYSYLGNNSFTTSSPTQPSRVAIFATMSRVLNPCKNPRLRRKATALVAPAVFGSLPLDGSGFYPGIFGCPRCTISSFWPPNYLGVIIGFDSASVLGMLWRIIHTQSSKGLWGSGYISSDLMHDSCSGITSLLLTRARDSAVTLLESYRGEFAKACTLSTSP